MAIENNLNVILIGETIVSILIAEKIKKHGSLSLLLFISDNLDIHQYAKANNINIIRYSEYIKKPIYCDYLFSVVNHNIIPTKIIDKYVNNLAINYHDSLLPDYAGLNSTTWAILNNEKKHGITWHLIDKKIDCGDILLQQVIDIDHKETAYSLNIKCSNLAIESFDTLVVILLTNNFIITKQDTSKINYFDKYHLPSNLGIITNKMSFSEVDPLIRSVNFGTNNINPVTSLKIMLNSILFIISKVKIRKINRSSCSLVKQKQNYILCCFEDCIISIHELRSIYGELIDINKTFFKSINISDVNYESIAKQMYYKAHGNEYRSLINNNSNYIKREAQIVNFYSYMDSFIKDDKIKLNITFYRECTPHNDLLILEYKLKTNGLNRCKINDIDNYHVIFKDKHYRLNNHKNYEQRILVCNDFNNFNKIKQDIYIAAFDVILTSKD